MYVNDRQLFFQANKEQFGTHNWRSHSLKSFMSTKIVVAEEIIAGTQKVGIEW